MLAADGTLARLNYHAINIFRKELLHAPGLALSGIVSGLKQDTVAIFIKHLIDSLNNSRENVIGHVCGHNCNIFGPSPLINSLSHKCTAAMSGVEQALIRELSNSLSHSLPAGAKLLC